MDKKIHFTNDELSRHATTCNTLGSNSILKILKACVPWMYFGPSNM